MFLIDKETLEIVAEVSHEWVVEHKEMWFDGVLDELNLAIVPSWGSPNSIPNSIPNLKMRDTPPAFQRLLAVCIL